jgi:hypothetical protein
VRTPLPGNDNTPSEHHADDTGGDESSAISESKNAVSCSDRQQTTS